MKNTLKNPTVHRFTHDYELTGQLTRSICRALENAVAERGEAYLVVSGGRTPIALFERLSQQILPWAKITVLLADERWLPADHEASNERLVKQHLLQHQAAAAKWVSLLTDHAHPSEAIETLNQRFADIPCFDVVILGLGEDGHTASLFPDSAQLEEGMSTENPVVAVTPTEAPHERISLSRSRILQSRQIYFHLVGQSKAEILEKVTQEHANFPATVFLTNHQVPVDVMLAVSKE